MSTRAHTIRWKDIEEQAGSIGSLRRDRWLVCLWCRKPIEEIEVCDEDRVDKSWWVIARCHGEEEGRSLRRSRLEDANSPTANYLALCDDWNTGYAFHQYRATLLVHVSPGLPEPTPHESICMRVAVESAITAFKKASGGMEPVGTDCEALSRVATTSLERVALMRFAIEFEAPYVARARARKAPTTSTVKLPDGSIIVGTGGQSYRMSASFMQPLQRLPRMDLDCVGDGSPLRSRVVGDDAGFFGRRYVKPAGSDRSVEEQYAEAAGLRWRILGEILLACSRAWASNPTLLELDKLPRKDPDFGDQPEDETAARFSLLEMD